MEIKRTKSLRQRLLEAIPDFPDITKTLINGAVDKNLDDVIDALKIEHRLLAVDLGHNNALEKIHPNASIASRLIVGIKQREILDLQHHVEDLHDLLTFFKKNGMEHDQLTGMILKSVNDGNYTPLLQVLSGRAQAIKAGADIAAQGKTEQDLSSDERSAREKTANALLQKFVDSIPMSRGMAKPRGGQIGG